jgi:hypothetical protein
MSADMQHLEEADLFEEVEGIISASDFIKNRRGPTALHLDPLDPPVAGWKPSGCEASSGPAEESAEHATTLARSLGVTGAPVVRRNGRSHLGDVLAAARPGGLAAGPAFHGSAHGFTPLLGRAGRDESDECG